MYLLTRWGGGGVGEGGVGGPDGKIFGSRSWCTDLAALGPYTMTES